MRAPPPSRHASSQPRSLLPSRHTSEEAPPSVGCAPTRQASQKASSSSPGTVEIAKWEAVGDVDVGKKIKALKKKVRAGGGGDSCEGGVDESLVHVQVRQIEELEERVKGGETLNEVSRTRLSSLPPPLPPSPCSLPLSLWPCFPPAPHPPLSRPSTRSNRTALSAGPAGQGRQQEGDRQRARPARGDAQPQAVRAEGGVEIPCAGERREESHGGRRLHARRVTHLAPCYAAPLRTACRGRERERERERERTRRPRAAEGGARGASRMRRGGRRRALAHWLARVSVGGPPPSRLAETTTRNFDFLFRFRVFAICGSLDLFHFLVQSCSHSLCESIVYLPE